VDYKSAAHESESLLRNPQTYNRKRELISVILEDAFMARKLYDH